jgi:hypothetical protein
VASRDAEIRQVTVELDALLGQLGDNVDALNAILTRPATDQGQEVPA